MKTLFLLFTIIISSSAFADQCAWNKVSDASSAKKLLKENDFILWCQNCGEKRPSVIFAVKDVKVAKPTQDYFEVVATLADGSTVNLDLAYTYVRTASDVFTNVAQLVGCPSVGATTFIQTGPGVKKVAHFYNKKGERVDVQTSGTEIRVSEYKFDIIENRMPASKNK